jgi:DNA mismatch repair protein MutS
LATNIEITNSNTSQAPKEYIRKQTLVNAERYITPEMKEYESLVLNAEERIHEIEGRLFKELCREITKSSKVLLETSRNLGELDVYLSFADVAALSGYTRPELTTESILEIHDGRHPWLKPLCMESVSFPTIRSLSRVRSCA